MFGYASLEEMLGKPIGTVFYHHPGDRDIFLAALKESGFVSDFEEILRKRDGTSIHVSVSSQYCYDKKGDVAGVEGVVRDLTERKRAEKEREQLQAQLNQARKMESIGILAGGIAHNFNNILMGIQGRTSLMMFDKAPGDPDWEHLKGIEEYVKNAVELTRDLLGFARGGKYEVRPTDLNALVRHESMRFGRTKREIRIHGKYEKGLWTVEVDRSQLQQALLNLYVNAWQAMPAGGDIYVLTENITVAEEETESGEIPPGPYVRLSVTDTGVGMDEATVEKIFDPFFSTRDTGQGSGLGLSSVYGIVRNHGGFIEVHSEMGSGTTFTLYLPASEKKVEERETETNGREIQHGRGTVLVVDDEEMIVEVDKRMLEKLGYRVLAARSGPEALDLFEKNKGDIDLVILDMVMPGMGGGETFERMKEMDGDVVVLLSSGYSMDEQAKEILARGCAGFIQKPFSIEDLSHKVRGALHGPETP
jgi:PAS domain S-box-containing protein